MPVKLTGSKGYPLTDQNNAAPKASKANDGLLPSKQGARVNRPQLKGKGTQLSQGAAPGASDKQDGNGFDNGHMSKTQMSDGGRNSPAHGKSHLKKWTTNDMAQAVRRRQKVAQTVD